jgi:predicted molibdopterin-dependent oxidoreductase YjgC
LIQSSYGSPGNFEVVVPEGHDLVHYWRKNSDGSKRWYRAQVITNRATGAASLIQSTYRSDSSAPGNFELIVMEGRDLVHYWRDNSDPERNWGFVITISTEASG